MLENNISKNKPQGNNVPDNGLLRSEPKGQHPNKPENSLSPRALFFSPTPADIQKQFDDLAESLNISLKEQENAIFERLSYNLSELEKQIGTINKDKQELEKKINEISNKTNEVIQTSHKAKQEIRKMSREVQVTERKSIEFLGIFVTLFTFISVSASTVLQFKNVLHSNFFLASFCFCLLLFLHLFHLVLRNEKLGKLCWGVFYFIALLGCGGGAFLCYYYGNKTQNMADDKNSSIQINYTQTNGYEQTFNPVIQQPQQPK